MKKLKSKLYYFFLYFSRSLSYSWSSHACAPKQNQMWSPIVPPSLQLHWPLAVNTLLVSWRFEHFKTFLLNWFVLSKKRHHISIRSIPICRRLLITLCCSLSICLLRLYSTSFVLDMMLMFGLYEKFYPVNWKTY